MVAALCEMLDLSTMVGCAFLVLTPLGLLVTFFRDPTSGVWVNNMALFTVVWLLYSFFGRNLVESLLSQYSTLYQGMDSAIKLQDANFVGFLVASVLFWMPAGAFLSFHVLNLGPVGFIPLYGGITRCLVLMGIAGEFVDLVSRRTLSRHLVVHHTIEIVVGGIMADSSLYEFEPGSWLLAMMAVVGRGPMVALMFDHVSREGTSDAVFPQSCLSPEGRRRIYSVAGVVTVLAVIVQPVVYIFSYVFLYFEDLPEINRMLMPCLTAVLIAVDVPVVQFFLIKRQNPLLVGRK